MDAAVQGRGIPQTRVLGRYGDKVRRKAKQLRNLVTNTRRKLAWRLINGRSHDTVPVFIVGSQRSGTGMLGDCLGKSPEIEDLGEIDTRAFVGYSLRDNDVIRGLIRECPYRFMVFKPLKDSHRVHELLGLDSRAKAIWAYRHFGDRINSAVSLFGRHPLEVFGRFQRGEGLPWQLHGISGTDEDLVRSFDVEKLSMHDGAALMWYIRNALFFNQQLDQRAGVFLWSYDRFVADPRSDIGALVEFLGASFHPFMVDDVHSRSLRKNPYPPINAEIEQLCASTYERLELARTRQIEKSAQ